MANTTKYYLDLNGKRYELYDKETHLIIHCGFMMDAGVDPRGDEQFTNKFDDYFQKTFGINTDEWEVG